MPRWTIVIPVKSGDVAKSRLGRSPRVARAIALDTIASAVRAAHVVVVTSDDEVAREAELLGADVVVEQMPAGLATAITLGLAGVSDDLPRAVLLGDLPALRPNELTDALHAAIEFPRTFVPDAEGTGSTLVTAREGTAFHHAFGENSAQRHRDAGLVELDIAPNSSLRRDVDLAEHLAAIELADLGPRTRDAISE